MIIRDYWCCGTLFRAPQNILEQYKILPWLLWDMTAHVIGNLASECLEKAVSNVNYGWAGSNTFLLIAAQYVRMAGLTPLLPGKKCVSCSLRYTIGLL